MLDWIATHPVTTALLCWIAFLILFYGGILWLWKRDKDQAPGVGEQP